MYAAIYFLDVGFEVVDGCGLWVFCAYLVTLKGVV